MGWLVEKVVEMPGLEVVVAGLKVFAMCAGGVEGGDRERVAKGVRLCQEQTQTEIRAISLGESLNSMREAFRIAFDIDWEK